MMGVQGLGLRHAWAKSDDSKVIMMMVMVVECVESYLSNAAADYRFGEGARGEARRARGERECESGGQYVLCTEPGPTGGCREDQFRLRSGNNGGRTQGGFQGGLGVI